MKRIGLLSDTHGFLDPKLEGYFDECDEVWHAGDVGPATVLDELATWGKELRFVYGNIDDHEVRAMAPLDLFFQCGNKTVFMTHIAGYPGRYNKRVRELISVQKPDIVVCGHSHILKVIYDKKLKHLHLNPGACGKHGFHQIRTALRFTIDGDDIRDMQVIELGMRGNSG
jgi:putative phosphoesterase